MKEVKDPHTGQTYIELSKDEVKMGFLAQCVEALAKAENCDYLTMLDRMEAVDMTEDYILKYYESLHTQSWSYVLDSLKEYLSTHEKKIS